MLSKRLSTTCYLTQNIKPYLSNSMMMMMIYHSIFHSIMSYGIIFWVNSSHSSVIFKLQKRVIRIIIGSGYTESCRKMFMDLKIQPLSSQYIFSILFFVVNNWQYFTPNIIYHNNNTRQRNGLHLSQGTLAVY